MSDTTVIAGSAPRTFRRFIERFPFLPALVILVVLLALNGVFEPNSLSYRAIRGLISTYLALILLGLGWNFGFIGGTAMLASAHTKAEQGRVQGMNDFAVFGMVTVASFSSGILMNCSGGSAVEGWSAVNYAMLPLLTLAGGALIWITFAGRQKTA